MIVLQNKVSNVQKKSLPKIIRFFFLILQLCVWLFYIIKSLFIEEQSKKKQTKNNCK